MKKILFILCLLFLPFNTAVSAVIEGAVSLTDEIPAAFFGSWKVKSVCIKSTNKELFELSSVDIWTLERTGDTIILTNPLSGARAALSVKDVHGKTVKFEKRSVYPDEESYESPVLTLNDDNFTGFDKIDIKTFENGKLIKTDSVIYKVRGEKISGAPVKDIFGIGMGVK